MNEYDEFNYTQPEPKPETSLMVIPTEDTSKKKSAKKRFMALALVLTVLNFAVLGGAFALGRYSVTNYTTATKTNLIEKMRNDGMYTQTAVATAQTSGEMSAVDISKKVGPSVVGITSTVQGQMNIFGTPSTSSSEGSGIILSEDGYIVTNNHVVSGATNILVTLNTGSEYEAKLVGSDSQTDLAVIKIEPKEDLVTATLGDSSNLEVGERVVAIGNPMGLEFFGSVTEGIVSAVNRSITIDNRTMNLIQTDAAINSGNSGGALINTRGEVIGINSVKVSYSGVEGMGFAIPSSEAKVIIADLLEFGYVKGRPVIGIMTRDVTEYMAQVYSWPLGVQVMATTGENARQAGLEQGDIITEANGESVTDTDTLNKIKAGYSPGDTISLKVYKYSTGKTESINLVLAEQLPE